MSKRTYRCAVPYCESRSDEKVLISIPQKDEIRRKWFRAIKQDYTKSGSHVCEDHFDLKNDLENYVKFSLTGGSKIIKRHIIPYKFHCWDKRRAIKDDNNKNNQSKQSRPSMEVEPFKMSLDMVSNVNMPCGKSISKNVTTTNIQNSANKYCPRNERTPQTLDDPPPLIYRNQITDHLEDPFQLHFSTNQAVTDTIGNILKYEVEELQIENNSGMTNSCTNVDSLDSATTDLLEEIKDEIEIEEFSLPENEEGTAPCTLIPKPIFRLVSARAEIQLPDLVFTFENRCHQPTQKELVEWINNEMFFNSPNILQSIKMIKLMNGCFIIRLKSSEKEKHLQRVFIQIGKCFNEARDLQIEKWKIVRFDIIPGSAWICIVNLPPGITDEEIIAELTKFGRILNVVNETLVPDVNADIIDGNTYFQMQISRHLPTDLVISGCIAQLNYCDSPITTE